MPKQKLRKFPRSRIATLDIGALGRRKHYIPALIEIDVTEGWEKMQQLKQSGHRISFTAWIIKVIVHTLQAYPEAAGYLKGKRQVVLFERVNVSVIIEKDLHGKKVPLPLLLEGADQKSVEELSREIDEAKHRELSEKDIVLQHRSGRLQRLYYLLPGFLRRLFWRYLLSHPALAYAKMGNVAVTSLGMVGKVDGWFIPLSVHPLCFGIGRAAEKPAVVKGQIVARQILRMSVLLDHDVIDGADMARFISALADSSSTL